MFAGLTGCTSNNWLSSLIKNPLRKRLNALKMKLDNTNNRKRREEEAAQFKATVCILIGWNDEQYCQYQYETMLAYLQWYLPNDQEGARMLEGSEIFRKWWCNHWSNRDNGFVRASIDWPATAETYELLYKEMNDPRTLACAIYPNGMIMRESVKAIIKDLFKPKPAAV